MLPGAEPSPEDARGARLTARAGSSLLDTGMRASQEHGGLSTLGCAHQWPGQVTEARRGSTEPAHTSSSLRRGGKGTTSSRPFTGR